jgi:hypothetical protein
MSLRFFAAVLVRLVFYWHSVEKVDCEFEWKKIIALWYGVFCGKLERCLRSSMKVETIWNGSNILIFGAYKRKERETLRINFSKV